LTASLAAVPRQGTGQAGGEVDGEADTGDEDARLDVDGSEAGRPPSAATTAKTTDSAVTTSGLADRRWAAAAGVMARLSTSGVPTTWAAPVTVRASSSRNNSPRRPTGTPRASATSGSVDANSSWSAPGLGEMSRYAMGTASLPWRMAAVSTARCACRAAVSAGLSQVPGNCHPSLTCCSWRRSAGRTAARSARRGRSTRRSAGRSPDPSRALARAASLSHRASAMLMLVLDATPLRIRSGSVSA